MNEEEDDSSFHSCSSGNNGVGSLAMHDNAEVNWNPTTLLVLNDITFDTVFANIVYCWYLFGKWYHTYHHHTTITTVLLLVGASTSNSVVQHIPLKLIVSRVINL